MEENLVDRAHKTIKNWWVSLLIGILAIGFGIWFIATPLSTLLALAILFVAGFFASGILEIIFAISNRDSLQGWGWTLASGVIDLLFGLLLLCTPGLTVMVLIYFVGFWIMFRSFWGIGTACELQKQNVAGWGWLLTLAILGILFSFLFILSPSFGGGFIVAMVSIAFIVYGIFRVFFAFKLKSIHDKLEN